MKGREHELTNMVSGDLGVLVGLIFSEGETAGGCVLADGVAGGVQEGTDDQQVGIQEVGSFPVHGSKPFGPGTTDCAEEEQFGLILRMMS